MTQGKRALNKAMEEAAAEEEAKTAAEKPAKADV
jgi:hypothetical protein